MEGHGLYWSGSGKGREVGCCKCSKEPSGSTKCKEYLNYLRTCWILRKDSGICSKELVHELVGWLYKFLGFHTGCCSNDGFLSMFFVCWYGTQCLTWLCKHVPAWFLIELQWKKTSWRSLHVARTLTTGMWGLVVGVMLLQLLNAVTSETHHFRSRSNWRNITEICCVMDTSQSWAQVSILL